MKRSVAFAVVIVLLLGANAYTLARLFGVQRELIATTALAGKKTVNDKTLAFLKLFIEKVLKADGEVSFEDRLHLENTVRDLKDNQVLASWNTFVESKTEKDAQEAAKRLLEVLAQKITP